MMVFGEQIALAPPTPRHHGVGLCLPLGPPDWPSLWLDSFSSDARGTLAAQGLSCVLDSWSVRSYWAQDSCVECEAVCFRGVGIYS